MEPATKQPVGPDVDPSFHEAPRKSRMFHTMIAVAYVGSQYSGSQIQLNPEQAHVRTIEGELLKALDAAGLREGRTISEMGFTRSSRTDRSVSAAMTLFSFFCRQQDGIADLVNAHLPADIRVFDSMRTIPKFSCKTFCTSRQYEYLAPISMFLGGYRHDVGAQPYKSSEKKERLLTDMADARARFVAKASALLAAEQAYSSISSYCELLSALKLDAEHADALQRIQAHDGPADEEPGTFDDLLLPILNSVASFLYLSKSRTYMNYSDGKIKSPNACIRKIYAFEFSKAIKLSEHQGVYYTRVSIRGQSFMMWQIRKMIGMLSLYTRGYCPLACNYLSLTSHARLPTIAAPGCYLLLIRPYFESISNRKEYTQYGPLLCDRPEVIDAAENFRHSLIYPEIAHVHTLLTHGPEDNKRTQLQDFLDTCVDAQVNYYAEAAIAMESEEARCRQIVENTVNITV